MRITLRPSTNVRRAQQAFTLPELTVAMGVFLLMITAVMSTHIFGLKMYEIARIKLGASDKARQAISKFNDEIRKAKLVRIGTGDSNSFTEVGLNLSQQGNTIQIYTSDNTNDFIRYFRDTDSKLKRKINTNGVVTIIADSITNTVVFTKEDSIGNIQTNDTGKYVIGLTLQFYELEFLNASINSEGLYDYYQLQTKIAPRN